MGNATPAAVVSALPDRSPPNDVKIHGASRVVVRAVPCWFDFYALSRVATHFQFPYDVRCATATGDGDGLLSVLRRSPRDISC